MRHVAIYVRVSSKAQDDRSQLPDLRRWAEVNANGTPVVWYRDKAAGGSMDRVGWQRLDRAATAGNVSRIVCWRLDRLGRTASGLTRLFDELRQRRVGLVSLRDGLDLETPAGRLMANVIASVAQYENEVRTEWHYRVSVNDLWRTTRRPNCQGNGGVECLRLTQRSHVMVFKN